MDRTKIGCCALVFDPNTLKVLALECSKGRGLTIPGGKWEEGETFREGALRELQEETGLKATTSPELIYHGMNVDNWYSYVYLVKYNGEEIYETPEGKPVWVDKDTLIQNSTFKAFYDAMFEEIGYLPIRIARMRP